MTPSKTPSQPSTLDPSVEMAFERFPREGWAALGSGAARDVAPAEIAQLVATGEPVSAAEVTDVYFPLAELLNLMAESKRRADTDLDSFLGSDRCSQPFIIGVAGGVAVGKSTTARVLQALLRRCTSHHSVDLLTTDGFLYPNATLAARGLMERKGFPESYDQRRLIEALAAIRSGQPAVRTPVYSHLAYDILPGQHQLLQGPKILIVEGLNVLQVSTKGAHPGQVAVSDFFDFSIYVDAPEQDVARWFGERLLALRSTVLQEPDSFFHRFALMPEEEVAAIAARVWADINLVNLRENIAPTRGRAHLILDKDSEHRVRQVWLRRY